MIDRYTLPKMREIWSEENKFNKWLEVELAVCESWNKLGKIPDESYKIIKNKASFNIERINEIEKEVNHDMIAFLTSVAEKVGEDSRFIHLGLTSYDVEDTALSLRLNEAAELIIADIESFIKIISKLAKKHKHTICMGRTHSVHAEPTTFGLKVAIWIAEMERNLARMIRAKESIRVGKISGAVGTYANLDPKIEIMVCEKLKLNIEPASNQVIQRDRHAEFVTTIAIIGSTIDQIAVEIRHLQRTEVLEVEEPFGKKQKGSSAMPHKKNPIVSERMSGMARLLRGYAVAALENVPLWHERDISHSSVERVMLPDACMLIDYMLITFSKILDGLVVYEENMLKNIELSGGLVFSEKIMLALVGKGLTREASYSLVQAAAMSARMKKNFKEEVLKDDKIGKYLSSAEVEIIFNLKDFIKNVDVVFKRMAI